MFLATQCYVASGCICNGGTSFNTCPTKAKMECLCNFENLRDVTLLSGGTLLVAQLAEALRYKPEDRGFDSRWCDCNFSLA